MEKSRLPRKFVAAWNDNSRPIGRPQTIMHHMCLAALCMIGAIESYDKQGGLEKWFPQIIEGPKLWGTKSDWPKRPGRAE
eukprot:15365086-Ditylum_brightwellii.AAC.1